MSDPIDSPYLVPFDGSFKLKGASTRPPKDAPSKAERVQDLERAREELDDLQQALYAHNRYALLLVFQAMDAAGKDSTIRAVMSGVNPSGCQVFSFKQPSAEELNHDFLWRSVGRLPERGRIGVFNRSYYEEVLVVRVHPEFLAGQGLPGGVVADLDALWEHRYQSIREHEEHLARSGTVILKFWLNVSKDEQRDRFLARLDEPDKNWKFAAADVRERQLWDSYMNAYADALRATSRRRAPWYAIPADSKSFMQMTVARIIVETLKGLDLAYPEVSREERARFDAMRAQLKSDD